jgi:hypothetical protein
MRSGHRHTQRVSAQQFKLDTCGLLAEGLDHDCEFQRGRSEACDEFIA